MAIFGLLGVLAQAALAKQPSSFCVDYSATPGDSSLLGYEVAILDPAATIDPAILQLGRNNGVRHHGYISLMEVDPKAEYFPRFQEAGIKTLGDNTDWGSLLVDVSDPKWEAFFLEQAAAVTGKGFEHFFLDTADSVQTIIKLNPEKEADYKKGLVNLIKSLRKNYPESEIIVNRGFDYLDSFSKEINGVLIESVFAAFNPQTKEYYDVLERDREWIRNQIKRVRKADLDIYILDYVQPGDINRAKQATEKIRQLGASPFISTPELQGYSPMAGEFRRKIMILYGHDPKLEEMPQISSPLDIAAESVVQASLEWMGYELVYHCIIDGIPKISAMEEFAGLVFDDSLKVPFAMELDFTNWIKNNVKAGRKLLFLGGYPFEDEISAQAAFAFLGLQNGEEWNLPVTKTDITVLDKDLMDFETRTEAMTRDFRATTSPEKSTIHLQLRDISDEIAAQTRFYDAVYTCSWGGAILSPYVAFDSSEEAQLFYVDIPRFLAKIWPSDHWPVPDVTTQDGLRIFYSHIDGDGFTSASSASSTDTEAICAEVMFDEVLKDLPYPITVSIVEAPLRAHLPFQKTENIPRYHGVAKKIFELPHVEPASHSYSHPYIWDLTNLEAQKSLYATLNLPLKLTARYAEINLEREIGGSLDFIREKLAPKGKPPQIMLWSGNCRPTPETVGIADAAGVENMNGGDTVICSRFPGLGNVSGKLIAMRDRIQVLASNQNEFLYTNGWRGPFHGGFSQVVETFEQTETPVRLKPVNVYYHFYSADRPVALQALQDIYTWCKKQDLHSMTAAQYARLVKDSHHTRVFRIAPDRWTMLNQGLMRTLRFSNDLGYPDLSASIGVTGFHRHKDWTYVHTDGSPRVELALSPTAPEHPYFQTADNSIQITSATEDELTFTVQDRTANITLAQMPAGTQATATLNNKRISIPVDTNGVLTLSVEPSSTFKIKYK